MTGESVRERRLARGRPQRVGAGERKTFAAADEARLGVIGVRAALGRQEHDLRARRLDRLAIVLEREIVDAAALQRDRAFEARRVDGDARAFGERLLAGERDSGGARLRRGRLRARLRLAAAVAASPARPCCSCCAACFVSGGGVFGKKKTCQANKTPRDRRMARMKLRLFSSMSLSTQGPQCLPGASGEIEVRAFSVSLLGRARVPWQTRVRGP